LGQLAQLRTATPTDSGGAFFDDARRQWADQGYAIIEGCLPAEACAALGGQILAAYGRFANAGSQVIGGAVSGHLNCFPGSNVRGLVEAAERAGVTRLVSEMQGAPLDLEHVGCNCNLPGSHYQTFHIDCSWARPCVIVNVALVETNFTNGAIELVAGVDEAPVPYWKFVASRRARRGVRPAMRPGDVLIRSSRVWHRGAPNLSDTMRPMLAMTFQPASEARAGAGYDQHDGQIAFLGNRFGANLVGRAKERLEAQLPWVSSALSFAGSLARRS
jgi:hypothetical protein